MYKGKSVSDKDLGYKKKFYSIEKNTYGVYLKIFQKQVLENTKKNKKQKCK